jgi:anaerobic selenocysteine-containing dehydrogenase
MLIQNTNPMSVAPEQEKVKRGFARDDLFLCVHEQIMTETAAMADIVLPANSRWDVSSPWPILLHRDREGRCATGTPQRS